MTRPLRPRFRASFANRIALTLLVGAFLCSVMSMVGVIVGVEPWLSLFAVTSEQNLPTWYATAALTLAALFAGSAAVSARVSGGAVWWRWCLVSVTLVGLSIDEASSLHERLGDVGASLVNASGVFHFAWVVPGMLLGGLALAVFIQLVRRLPAAVGMELRWGFGIFLIAAIGLEMVGGFVLDAMGDGWTYVLTATAEEFLETFGIIVVMHATCRMLSIGRTYDGAILIRYGCDDAARSTSPRNRALASASAEWIGQFDDAHSRTPTSAIARQPPAEARVERAS